MRTTNTLKGRSVSLATKGKRAAISFRKVRFLQKESGEGQGKRFFLRRIAKHVEVGSEKKVQKMGGQRVWWQ